MRCARSWGWGVVLAGVLAGCGLDVDPGRALPAGEPLPLLAYHRDALARADDLLTAGPLLGARPLTASEAAAARDRFLAALEADRWLQPGERARLAATSRLDAWRSAMAGGDVRILEAVGGLVRARQRADGHAALTADRLVQALIGARAAGFDAHTALVPPPVAAAYVESAVGVATGLGLALEAADGGLVVARLLPEGPAERAGVLAVGDRLREARVDGGPWVALVDVPDALALFRQATRVTLRVSRGGRRFSTRLDPAAYAVADERLSMTRPTVPTAHGPVAALRLQAGFFYERGAGTEGLAGDVADALRDAHPRPDLVILDLRDARGGALPDAAALAALFTPSGPLGSVRGADGAHRSLARPAGESAWTGPLQIWVGPRTASAAEWAAQAIRDRAPQAVVLGWPTYGKGTLQRRMALDLEAARTGKPDRLGELWVTVGELYGPAGRSLQRRGVALDGAWPGAVDEPWGERALARAWPTGPDAPGATTAPRPEAMGDLSLHPAWPDSDQLPALLEAAGRAWRPPAR